MGQITTTNSRRCFSTTCSPRTDKPAQALSAANNYLSISISVVRFGSCATGLLVGHGENSNDTLHGFRCINGMQRGHNQVTCFRGLQSNLNRLPVAHFADENDFRGLPKRRAQCERKSRSVRVQFALMDGRFLVTMKKFDGVFNGEDMVGLLLIHLVEDGGECGGFPGTCRPCDKHNTVPQIHNFLQAFREMQLIEPGDFVGNDTHYNGAASALFENIHSKARHTRDSIGKVCRAILLELADGRLVFSHDVVGNSEGVLRGQTLQSFVFELHEVAAYFDLWGAAGGETQVADVRTGHEKPDDPHAAC